MKSSQSEESSGRVRARKDRALVYRACSPSYATLLGGRDPAEVIGRTDSELLRASRSTEWEASQRLVLLEAVHSVTPMVAHGRAGAWMVQQPTESQDGVDIEVVSAPNLLAHLRSVAPESLFARAFGVAVVRPASILRADKSAHAWLRGLGGHATVLSQLPEIGQWRAWFERQDLDLLPQPAQVTVTLDGDRCAACWCMPLRWHRQRCVMLVPLSVAASERAVPQASPEPLARPESIAKLLLDSSPTGTLLMDGQRVTHANASAASLLGYGSAEALCEHTVLPMSLLAQLAECADNRDAVSCRWRRQGGGDLPLQLTASWVQVAGLPRLALYLNDQQPVLQQLAGLTAERERFHDFAESAADFFFELDADLRFCYLSDRFESVFGVQPEEILGLSIESFHSRYLPQPTSREWVRHLTALRSGQTQLDFEYRWMMSGSNPRILVHSCHAVLDADGVFCGFRGVGRDMTRDRELAAQVQFHASHDALTGLVNRREFERLLANAIDDAKRHNTRHVLCYVDLDHFKAVNDRGGHQAGDAVLRELGSLFMDSLRQSDVVGRLGGDEFGVLIYNCSMQKAQRLAEDLRDAVLAYRLKVNGDEFQVGASIGLAPINVDSNDLATVMRNADLACYDVKHAGRGRTAVSQDNQPGVQGEAPVASGSIQLMREMLLPLADSPSADIQRIASLPVAADVRLAPFQVASRGDTGSTGRRVEERQVLERVLAWLDVHSHAREHLAWVQLSLPGVFLQESKLIESVADCLERSNWQDGLRFELPLTTLTAAPETSIAALAQIGRFAVADDTLGARFSGQFGVVVSAEAATQALRQQASKRALRARVDAARSDGLAVHVEGLADPSLLPALRDVGVDHVSGAAVSSRDLIEPAQTH